MISTVNNLLNPTVVYTKCKKTYHFNIFSNYVLLPKVCKELILTKCGNENNLNATADLPKVNACGY